MPAVLDKPKPSRKRRWTYEEYYRLDDDRRYELYNGELIPMQPPSPSPGHQREALELTVILREFVRTKKLGEVFVAPLDVIFDDKNTAQPDIIFIAKANAGLVQERGIFGAPDLVVEIVSPGSVRRDRYEKQALYARFGVKEYWIFDHGNQSLEVLTLNGSGYVVHSAAEKSGYVTSRVLRGLKVRLSDLA